MIEVISFHVVLLLLTVPFKPSFSCFENKWYLFGMYSPSEIYRMVCCVMVMLECLTDLSEHLEEQYR